MVVGAGCSGVAGGSAQLSDEVVTEIEHPSSSWAGGRGQGQRCSGQRTGIIDPGELRCSPNNRMTRRVVKKSDHRPSYCRRPMSTTRKNNFANGCGKPRRAGMQAPSVAVHVENIYPPAAAGLAASTTRIPGNDVFLCSPPRPRRRSPAAVRHRVGLCTW